MSEVFEITDGWQQVLAYPYPNADSDGLSLGTISHCGGMAMAHLTRAQTEELRDRLTKWLDEHPPQMEVTDAR